MSKTFNSKLGKKNISDKIKTTTKLCYGKAVQNYAQFLISKKKCTNQIMGDTQFLDVEFFDFFEPKPPTIHQWPHFLETLSSSEELDFELLNIINYNLKYSNKK